MTLYFQNPEISEAAAKVTEILSKKNVGEKVAKKGIPHSGKIYRKTRLGQELQPKNKNEAAFNLKNLKLAKDAQSLKYQCQKFAELVGGIFESNDFALKKRAEVVSTLLKQFQVSGVFTHVDSCIFTASENLVSFFTYLILNSYKI